MPVNMTADSYPSAGIGLKVYGVLTETNFKREEEKNRKEY